MEEANLSDHQIKVLILYTLSVTPGPVPRSVIESALARCDVNIFGIQLALSDLIENENLREVRDEDDAPYLFLTDRGALVAEQLMRETPFLYRQMAMAYAADEMSKMRSKVGVSVTLEPIHKYQQDYYLCHLEMKDNEIPMMDLTFYAPNETQAKAIRNRFTEEPLYVYRRLLAALIEPKEENEERK